MSINSFNIFGITVMNISQGSYLVVIKMSLKNNSFNRICYIQHNIRHNHISVYLRVNMTFLSFFLHFHSLTAYSSSSQAVHLLGRICFLHFFFVVAIIVWRPVSTLARWRPVCVWAAVNVRGQAPSLCRERRKHTSAERTDNHSRFLYLGPFLPPSRMGYVLESIWHQSLWCHCW